MSRRVAPATRWAANAGGLAVALACLFPVYWMVLTSFRRRIGVVPQDAFLFKGTVGSNIAYGRPDASRDEIADAARMVGAWVTAVNHGPRSSRGAAPAKSK